MSRIPVLEQMLAAEPTDPFLLFALAKEYETRGEMHHALDFYLRCQAHNPDYVGLYYHLGRRYEADGKPEKAIKTYKQGLDVAKKANDRHAFSELQQAYNEISDEDDF